MMKTVKIILKCILYGVILECKPESTEPAMNSKDNGTLLGLSVGLTLCVIVIIVLVVIWAIHFKTKPKTR